MVLSFTVTAQVKKMAVDIYGNFEVTVKVGESVFVTINSMGEITDIEIDGSRDYYSSSDSYGRGGKLSSGSTYFTKDGISFHITGGN
ncbi:MAG: hypothetical protein WCX48_09405 [Bacteroidales bacterium]